MPTPLPRAVRHLLHDFDSSKWGVAGMLRCVEREPSAERPSLAYQFDMLVLGRLGKGGMGITFLVAFHTGEFFVCKIPRFKQGIDRARLKRRFFAEISALGGVHHRHIVKLKQEIWIVSPATQKLRPAFLMEYVPGGTLKDVINPPRKYQLPRATITLAEALRIADEVASALTELHSHDIVHRDIKPENVFIDCLASAIAKIGDLGVARQLKLSPPLTQVGTFVPGTAGYNAPEMIDTGADVTGAADYFGLGCTLFEILTRKPAFPSNPLDPMDSFRTAIRAPNLSELENQYGAKVVNLVARLLEKDPAKRLRTLPDLRSEINSILPSLNPGDSVADQSVEGITQCVHIGFSLESGFAPKNGRIVIARREPSALVEVGKGLAKVQQQLWVSMRALDSSPISIGPDDDCSAYLAHQIFESQRNCNDILNLIDKHLPEGVLDLLCQEARYCDFAFGMKLLFSRGRTLTQLIDSGVSGAIPVNGLVAIRSRIFDFMVRFWRAMLRYQNVVLLHQRAAYWDCITA